MNALLHKYIAIAFTRNERAFYIACIVLFNKFAESAVTIPTLKHIALTNYYYSFNAKTFRVSHLRKYVSMNRLKNTKF